MALKYVHQIALHIIEQMVIEYTNLFHCKTLPNLPKLGFFGLKSGNPACHCQSWRSIRKQFKIDFKDTKKVLSTF
jgi:hypothetical protein